MDLIQLTKQAKKASYSIMTATSSQKNELLQAIAQHLKQNIPIILKANATDIAKAKKQKTAENLIDRMTLDKTRLDEIIKGVIQLIQLPDPIDEVIHSFQNEDGLHIDQIRVPLGVIAMIYEARPNVSIDAAALGIKSGNAIILRGSKDIINSNRVIVSIIQDACISKGFDPFIIQMMEDTSHEAVNALIQMRQYIDVIIPRGSALLIQSIIENSRVPVIETGSGNCHIFVDAQADLQIAQSVIINAKTSRTSVCNACESILFHKDLSNDFKIQCINALLAKKVKIHASKNLCSLNDKLILANDRDYGQEYLDLEVSIKEIDDVKSAIQHINQYSTHHSDCIISQNQQAIELFMKQVDSACVYANASTRFSDGFKFNLGAEIGISTQKLHARGPMGLNALTSYKYQIKGNGQIR